LQEVGEIICDQPPGEFEGDNPISRALYPVRGGVANLAKLRERRSKMEQDLESVREQRIAIERREHMRNPVRNMEHQIRRLESEAAAACMEVGELYVAQHGRHGVDDERVATMLQSIRELDEKGAADRKMVRRLRAAEEVERLERERASIDGRIDSLKAEAAALQAKSAELSMERERQVKARGSKNTLELVDEDTAAAADRDDGATDDSRSDQTGDDPLPAPSSGDSQ
jgi:hypothetical protein